MSSNIRPSDALGDDSTLPTGKTLAHYQILGKLGQHLGRIAKRCLEKNPDRCYQTRVH